MSDVQEVLRRSIQGKCGTGGLMKFSAIYSCSFENDDGSPDMSGIIEALGHTFPPYQAADIIILFKKKMKIKEMRAANGQVEPNVNPTFADMSQTFARYFNSDAGQIRDIVNEARQLRVAMGKSIPPGWAPQAGPGATPEAGDLAVAVREAIAEEAPLAGLIPAPESETFAAVEALAGEAAAVPPAPPASPVVSPARPGEIPSPTVDDEIKRFAYGRKVCTSIDIIDFIRYLKDKGYSFQEQIVLEKIYVTIEERKKEARSAIEKEVEGLFYATQAPNESDICGLIERLDSAGLVFDEDDVRRVVRDALMRRSSIG